MKICQEHWKALRKEIEDLGFGDMISKSGDELAKRMESAPTARTFDPLMAAHNMIISNGLNRLGLELMARNEAGEHKCPVCEVEKHGATGWIHSAAKGACDYAAKLKAQDGSKPE